MLNCDARPLKKGMVTNYSVFEAIWRDNPMNCHVSSIISSVEINYELKQEVIVWNGMWHMCV